MKTILLWDPRNAILAPKRLTLPDEVASAAVRSGLAAAANPGDQGALQVGGAVDPANLREVAIQHGVVPDMARVWLPEAVIAVAAPLGIVSMISGSLPSGVAPTLAALTLSSYGGAAGSPFSANILGKTAGSTITIQTNPGGRYSLGGSGESRTLVCSTPIATTENVVLRETLAGATNNPRDSSLGMTFAGEGAPVNTAPPEIEGLEVDGATQTLDYGLWDDTTSLTVEYQRDGVTITTYTPNYGDAAPTRAFSAANDVGKARRLKIVAHGPDGDSEPVYSPVRVAFPEANYYRTSFANDAGNPDPTLLYQYNEASSPAGADFTTTGTAAQHQSLRASGNELKAYASGNSVSWLRSNGATKGKLRVWPMRNPGDNATTQNRLFYVSYADTTNFAYVTMTGTFVTLYSRVGGTDTVLINAATSGYSTGDVYAVVPVVDSGNLYYQLWKNGVHLSESVALNGGKGAGPIHATLAAATQVGFRNGIGDVTGLTLPANYISEIEYVTPQANALLVSTGTLIVSPDDATKVRIPLLISYLGTANNAQVMVLGPSGEVLLDWTAAGTPTYVDVTGADNGGIGAVYVRDPDLPGSIATCQTAFPVLPLVLGRLGANHGYDRYYSTQDKFTDAGGSGIEWTKVSDGGAIVQRSKQITSAGAGLTSADGAGSTFKMDMDGKFYGTNGAGETEFFLGVRRFYARAGTYQIKLVPGLTITAGAVSGSWSYVDDTLSYTIDTAGVSRVNYWKITKASIEAAGGVPWPQVKLSTDPALGAVAINSVAAASIPQIASVSRCMTESDVNHWDNRAGGRTATALPVDTVANYGTQGNFDPISRLIALANIGQDVWMTPPHTAGDSLITAWATRLAASVSAMAMVLAELANEIWNEGFPRQFLESKLEGCRRGYGPIGVTTHAAAVPETIIDGAYSNVSTARIVNRNTRAVTGSYPAGTLMFAEVSGVGWQVYQATGTTVDGQTLPAGSTEGTSANNWTIKYNTTSTFRAQLRWIGRRSKEVWALMDAAFAAAGKPRPLHVISWQATSSFSVLQPALDFDSVYLEVDRVAIAPYYGGGVAGYELGNYMSAADDGWTEAQRDLMYAGNTAGFIAAYLPRATTAANAVVSHVRTNWTLPVAIYAKANRGNKDAIRVTAYELGDHGTPFNYPDQCPVWSPGTWDAGTFAVGSDDQTYRAITTNSVNPVGNPAQWALFVDGNGATWNDTKSRAHRNATPRTVEAAFTALYRSEEYATLRVTFYRGLINAGVAELMDFQRNASNAYNIATNFALGYMPITGVGIDPWRTMMSEVDTSSNEMFDAYAALNAELQP
ncbi:hypothetical protein ACFB49_42400 [Sphingomonas sp. DBB INV C78]|uniref:hypothetical protein n=1 Tax=Sphingomonas sp. DBB INV C78 TaxID=3349434 RepID=UPI0036D3B81E